MQVFIRFHAGALDAQRKAGAKKIGGIVIPGDHDEARSGFTTTEPNPNLLPQRKVMHISRSE
jgi:hypothetical protein